jgi:hypothetical protein
MSEERWDKDIHPSNRFEARWAHPWWDVQSFQKNEAYQKNLASAKDFTKEVTDKWLPMFKEKGWIKPGETLIEERLAKFTKALAEHEDYIKKVNGLGNYLAVPISREDKIEKYLPLMKEGGEIIDRMMMAARDIKHSMVILGRDDAKGEIKSVELEHRLPDPESELYKKMTLEANKVPEPIRREQEAKAAKWNRDYKRSRSKED